MTNEEAERLIAKATKRLKGKTFKNSRMTGLWALCLLPFSFVSGYGIGFGTASGIFAFMSAICYFTDISDNQELKKKGAWETWDSITTFDFSIPHTAHATFLLKNSIAVVYQEDTNAQTFPLVQAIRLLDAHARQEERLQIVENRLNELNALSGGMTAKLARLRELGEDVPEAQRRLSQLERDEAALGNIASQIAASCARLEAIFTGVQHAHQVRQLKRELGELSQVAGSSSDSGLALDGDAFDIERQIGREIETFLRLERETDQHLRDV